MPKRFRNRAEAGRKLANALALYAGLPDVTVLALPGGGVPVGREVARALHVPLQVFVVARLGMPGGDATLGWVASGGVVVLDRARHGLSAEALQAIVRSGCADVARREREYEGETLDARMSRRTVILVDDGVAAGDTMLSAIRAVRALAPSWVVAAAPVLAGRSYPEIASAADQVVCVTAPLEVGEVSDWYRDSRGISHSEAGEAPPVSTVGRTGPRGGTPQRALRDAVLSR
jgi:putative phosphoribosyl transferase